ncbi:Eco57I restriction-modification methylase domain-containing protein [Ligilactobacillus salivarius]|uniref:Eco57I restriction-modification methylase domain-containing protein n=1 Tax=Ligilactobacillus salivarius TaxID=1624 RepID=UPI00269FABAD|nr:Eco57I restriction-modification methylase domain-containing protein [Ligilactobacillus salivarius]
MVVEIENLEEITLFNDSEDVNKDMKFDIKDIVDDENRLMKNKDRVQQHGEVFTPNWMVKKMLSEPEIQLKLQDVQATFLEPSVGEGAFLKEILHQKLGYIDDTSNKSNWTEKALWVLTSIYGIELLTDNLVKAKQQMMKVLIEHYQTFYQKKISSNTDFYKSASFIIDNNIVQGNTLTYLNDSDNLIMFSKWKRVGDEVSQLQFTYKSLLGDEEDQLDLFESSGQLNLLDDLMKETPDNEFIKISKVYKGGVGVMKDKFKFDVVIGNPPYQEESIGDNKTFAPPVYHKFLDQSYKVGNIVEMIHPGRFLFNAGSTPKAWNKKMLSDRHLKVLYYEQNSAKVFANTDIKGGVAVTYRNIKDDNIAIGVFTPYDELNKVKNRVITRKDFFPFSEIVSSRGPYRFTEKLHEDHPDARSRLSKGHDYDVSSNVFTRLSNIFYDEKPNNNKEYIKILGRENAKRVFKYIEKDYIKDYVSLNSYKVIIPQANGSGAIGEVLSTPLIGEPLIGHTETFLSIGNYKDKKTAENLMKYIKTKFARALLGIKKITQSNVANKWDMVPLQDFTSNSDIDWTKSIHEIDEQLYRKYNLSKDEIEFIETKVKEMN